jgi:deazaflavin-dependent oxidoreductase (nitroreductase family)
VLLLTTTGRNTSAKRTTPLIYQRHGDDYLVVASNGGDPPSWFLNLERDPNVAVQVKAEHHTVRARVATPEEKPELWRTLTATGTPSDEFQAKANREIPVVILQPREAEPPLSFTTHTPRASKRVWAQVTTRHLVFANTRALPGGGERVVRNGREHFECECAPQPVDDRSGGVRRVLV